MGSPRQGTFEGRSQRLRTLIPDHPDGQVGDEGVESGVADLQRHAPHLGDGLGALDIETNGLVGIGDACP